MSAVMMTGRVGAEVAPATYRRRRAMLGGVAAVLVACTSVLAHDILVGSGGVPASAAASQPVTPRAEVRAQPGDSLWSLAQRFHGDVPIGRYVDELVELNGGARIYAGQKVVLP